MSKNRFCSGIMHILAMNILATYFDHSKILKLLNANLELNPTIDCYTSHYKMVSESHTTCNFAKHCGYGYMHNFWKPSAKVLAVGLKFQLLLIYVIMSVIM